MIIDKTRTMYGGKVKLDYSDASHRYMFEGGRRVSCTTITGMIDDGKSGRLQGWAVKMVRQALQAALMALVPVGSDTLTIKARDLAELIVEACKSYRKKTEKAADIGTQVHGLVEQHVLNKIKNPKGKVKHDYLPGTDKRVVSGFKAYLAWEREHHVKYLASEMLVYSLEHDYAGTLDILAVVDGDLCVVDIKTSNYIYETHKLQAAGYAMAYNEEVVFENNLVNKATAFDQLVHRRWIVQLSKEDGTFNAEDLGTRMDKDEEAFLAALVLYRRFK